MFATNTYSCDAYGAGDYSRCVASTAANGGFLGDTGTRILFMSVAAIVLLFVSLATRYIIKRRATVSK